MKKVISILAFCALCFGISKAQKRNLSADELIVSPSGFKLLAENVSYDGVECSPREKSDEIYTNASDVIKIGDDIYYQGHRFWSVSRGDGLIRENFSSRICRKYPLSDLAKAAGWREDARHRGGLPDSTRGLFRVGRALWMGSNGIGIAIYDLERKTWSRIDLKSTVIAGDHLQINYADDDYAFVTRGEFPGASLHVYSVKKNKWLGLKAVPTKFVREYGYTTGIVQVPVDHRVFAKSIHIPIDWTFMGLTVALIDGGKAYSFENKFSDTKTVFEISKSQLEQAFSKKL